MSSIAFEKKNTGNYLVELVYNKKFRELRLDVVYTGAWSDGAVIQLVLADDVTLKEAVKLGRPYKVKLKKWGDFDVEEALAREGYDAEGNPR